MNYPKVLSPPSQFYSHQVFYENPEYIDEAESFIDSISFSESDGFIGFPMVRSVPSYDIQEIYMRNPLTTSSHMLPVQHRNRRHINGQRNLTPEYVYGMKPRPPRHLKNPGGTNSMVTKSSPYDQCVSGAPRHACATRHHSRSFTTNNRDHAMAFRSTPTVAVGSQVASVPKELAKGFMHAYQTRPRSRSNTPMPRKNLGSTSEPSTNYQGRDPRGTPCRNRYPSRCSSTEEPEPFEDFQQPQYPNCKSYPVIVECEGEVKKMNSEGDATGYADMDELDTIERIAATLDENETEKLSDKQKMEIREMSKILKPRVPSSVRSVGRSESAPLNDDTISIDKEDVKKFHVTFRKSLDSILNQLDSCESSLNAVKAKFSNSKNEPKTSEEGKSKTFDSTIKNGIFNLKEISEKIQIRKEAERSPNEEGTIKPVGIPETRSGNTIGYISSGFESRSASGGIILDEEKSVLDLHQSKSYIVNLIDKALSKELGTTPNEPQERFQDLNPIKAVRHIKLSRPRKPYHLKGRTESDSESNVKEEEPPYIKQLKELRWGHFKHILQEVKRLEDLERFLDNCSTTDGTL